MNRPVAKKVYLSVRYEGFIPAAKRHIEQQ